VLGKLNPFQLLVMAIIESGIFVLNSYLGYRVLGTLDVGMLSFVPNTFYVKTHFDEAEGQDCTDFQAVPSSSTPLAPFSASP
jgi:hypothetical protein